MGKTSDKNMRDLSKKILKQIEKVEDGKLKVRDLDELVNDAKDLYEKLVIVKFKAYEKYGEPKVEKDKGKVENENEEVKEVEKSVTDESSEVKQEKTKGEEEKAFDLSGEPEEIEQPAFDFSISEEKETTDDESTEDEGTFPEDEDIKSTNPTAKKEESETFPEDSQTKGGSDVFTESHVEKHEPEDENSLNQKLKEEEDLSLRKKLQKTPVADLKSEISIAKKFEYITFMFDGKNEVYEEAIESLNTCNDGEQAREKLNEYSTKYNWDLENKSIIKFVELVERRYL